MFLKAFQEGLRALGLPEAETFVIESRFAEGDFERIPSLVADLVRLDVKVIFVAGTPAATRVTRETAIPVIMIGDPVGAKLAAFAIQYVAFRLLVGSRLRAAARA